MLLVYSLMQLTSRSADPLVLHPLVVLLYPFYVLCGIAILYSLMITLAATSIWLGRNQTLYNFWFYITNFSRYPMEIYGGRYGAPLRAFFTFVIPVLVVVNVPARLLALPFRVTDPAAWSLPAFALLATVASLVACPMRLHPSSVELSQCQQLTSWGAWGESVLRRRSVGRRRPVGLTR